MMGYNVSMGRISYRSLSRYKYQLQDSYVCDTNIALLDDVASHGGYVVVMRNGTMVIGKGYAWDGASGPTIDTESTMRASLIHDAWYQLMREGLVSTDLRQYVDELFKIHCLEDGMSKFRAWYYYWGVRIGGAYGSRSRRALCGKRS